MPTTEWLNKYESIKDKLACKTDLDAHFTEKVIGNREVDVLDIGSRPFPHRNGFRLRSAGGAGGHAALYPDDPRRDLSREDLRGAQ